MNTKNLLSTIVILFFLGCSSNSKYENDVTRLNLKGKVKSINEFSYEAIEKFGNIKRGKRKRKLSWDLDEYIIFDNKGNKIEENKYSSDGNLKYKYTYKYDNKGNKIEVNYYNSDGSLESKQLYKYDNNGNEIEADYYNPVGSLADKWTYKYNEKGNIIEVNNYNSAGSLIGNAIHKYDEKGKRIEANLYISDGRLDSKFI